MKEMAETPAAAATQQPPPGATTSASASASVTASPHHPWRRGSVESGSACLCSCLLGFRCRCCSLLGHVRLHAPGVVLGVDVLEHGLRLCGEERTKRGEEFGEQCKMPSASAGGGGGGEPGDVWDANHNVQARQRKKKKKQAGIWQVTSSIICTVQFSSRVTKSPYHIPSQPSPPPPILFIFKDPPPPLPMLILIPVPIPAYPTPTNHAPSRLRSPRPPHAHLAQCRPTAV